MDQIKERREFLTRYAEDVPLFFYYVCPTDITYPSDFFTTSARRVLHTHQNNINGNYFLCMMCVRQFLQVKWFSLMQCIHAGCMSCEFLTYLTSMMCVRQFFTSAVVFTYAVHTLSLIHIYADCPYFIVAYERCEGGGSYSCVHKFV